MNSNDAAEFEELSSQSQSSQTMLTLILMLSLGLFKSFLCDSGNIIVEQTVKKT